MKLILSIAFILFAGALLSQKTYKRMMNDMSINFYDVCKEADKYFETHDKTVKGSGWKGYQRWRVENESKYAPSGQRDNVDPFLVSKAYNRIKSVNASRSLYANGWVDLGPYSIDSITGHYSAGIGRVEDFAVNPLNQDQLYLGSRSGGFWKSTNGGADWQGAIVDFLPACGVNAIATSPTNFDSVLINVRQGGNGTSHGVYRSTDGGASFQQTPFNPVNLNKGGLGSNWGINQIAYHPTIPNLIFVTASDGLYRSSDNLVTWAKVTNGSISEIEFHPSNPNIVYVYDYYYWGSNKNVVLISTDGGLTFNAGNTVVGNNNNSSVKLSVSPQCDSCIWFASGKGIWKSTNNGTDFSLVNAFTSGSQGFLVDDLDTSKMMSGYVDAWRSENGGDTLGQCTWWSLGSSSHNAGGGGNQNVFNNSNSYIHADLRVAKSINGVWYVGTDGFLCKSLDRGANWEIVSNDNGIREFYLMGSSQSNHYRTIAGSQDNGMSIKHKDTWIEFNGGDGMEALIHPLNDDWMFGSFQYGTRYRTKDGGQSNVGGHSGFAGYWEAPMFYNPNNHMEVFSFTDSIHSTPSFGNDWYFVGEPSFSGDIQQADIAQNNDKIFVVSRGSNIEKTIDRGLTFNSIRGSLPNYTITDIAFNPLNDDNIFVTYNRYQNDGEKVYMTSDGGVTWVNITFNLNDMPLRTIVVDHLNNIYVGGEIGVFTMPIGGSNWVVYNQNLPNVTVKELEVVRATNTLRAATWGRGLWGYSLVGRENYPAVLYTEIDHKPTDETPKEGVEEYVRSIISYTTGTLSSVYVKWSVDSISFDSIIPMTNISDSTWLADAALPLADSGQKVYFKVYAVGGFLDTTETYKFMYEVREFAHCEAQGYNDGNSLALANVSIGNLNNTSGNDTTIYYKDSVVYFIKDSTYPIAMEATRGWGTIDHGIWIDFNKDANFKTDEMIHNAPNIGRNSTGSFTVPSNAIINDTLLMRTRVSYWPNQAPPCGTTLGEVEDYPVIIIETPNLTYSLTDATLCNGDNLNYTYTGDAVDSINWTFSDGINTFNSVSLNGVINNLPVGAYNISIEGYLKDFTFLKSYPNAFEVKANTIDNTLVQAGAVLTANQASVIYQWIDCGTNMPIVGETNQSYTSTSNGIYAVQLNDNYCTDTSSCVTIATVSLMENELNSVISVYPNPIQEELTISMGKTIDNGSVNILNEAGKLVSQYKLLGTDKLTIQMTDFTPGVYFVETIEGDKKSTIKILKK